MKKSLIIYLLLVCMCATAQHYATITADNGYMINADPGFIRMGLGASASWLIPVHISLGSELNFITISGSGISYPHTGEPYSLKNLNNAIDDSFNYTKLQIGFRQNIRFPEQCGSYMSYRGWRNSDGLALEHRIGTAIYDLSLSNPTVILTTYLHYTKNHVQMSAYMDYGQARHHTNIGYITIFACGVSFGVCF